MAALDKQHEFFTCAQRFAFLAARDMYRPLPEDFKIPENVHAALDVICDYFFNNKEFCKRAEESQEWFDEAEEQFEMIKRKDLISQIVKECCR